MRINLFITFLIISLFYSIGCKKKKNICLQTPITNSNIQGNWLQNYVGLLPSDFSFVAPPRFEFTFKNDSFYIMLNQISDIIADTNGCPYLNWYEYAKGIYSISGDKLLLRGIYTESDYKEKKGGCYNSGIYLDTFKAKFCNDTLILNWALNYNSEIHSRDCKMYNNK